MTNFNRTTFLKTVSEQIGIITSANLGKPSWVAAVELEALAREIDSSEITAETLENEIKLCNSHFYLDGHNWSDSFKAYNENFVDFCRILKTAKAKVGA